MATKRRAELPTVWLMTDERLGGRQPDDPLWQALARLPRGSGVVLRHHLWNMSDRRWLCSRIAVVARRRGLLVVASGFQGPDGVHRPAIRRGKRAARGITTASAHGRRELAQAVRSGADLVFLSPVFPTRSHPGAPTLGTVRFGLIARHSGQPVIALGGMTPQRAARLKPLGAAGFAAIDWWLR